MAVCCRAKYDKVKVEKIHKCALELEEMKRMKDGQNSSRFSKLSSFKQRPESRNHQENRMFMTRMLSPSPYTKPRKSTFIKSVSDLDKNSESKTATKDCETTETCDSDFDIDIKLLKQKKRVDLNPNALIYRDTNSIHGWLKSHGKHIGLDRNKQRELKELFCALDENGSASLGIDELETPLITLGLVNNRQEIKDIIKKVDTDHTGEIELDEFLEIFTRQNIKEEKKENHIKEFFHYLESGEYMKQKDTVSFNFFLAKLRRKRILEAMSCSEAEVKRILKNISNQMETKFIRDHLLSGLSEAKVLTRLVRMTKEEEYKCHDPPDPKILLDILKE